MEKSSRNNLVFNEETGTYTAKSVTKADIIETAKSILAAQVRQTDVLSNPEAVTEFLTAQFSELPHEVFGCLFLDNRHRLIRFEVLFRGTIDGASVHPREVVKDALYANAAAVIFAHNHPSGVPEPSKADISLTKRLTDALGLVDIRVLDHIVVGGVDTVSFAERGLL